MVNLAQQMPGQLCLLKFKLLIQMNEAFCIEYGS